LQCDECRRQSDDLAKAQEPCYIHDKKAAMTAVDGSCVVLTVRVLVEALAAAVEASVGSMIPLEREEL
jgi:hypothetical protein